MGSLWDESSESLSRTNEDELELRRDREAAYRERTAALIKICKEFASTMQRLKVRTATYTPVVNVRKETASCGPVPVKGQAIRGWLVREDSAMYELLEGYTSPHTEVIVSPEGVGYLRYQGEGYASLFGIPVGVKLKPLWRSDASHISESKLRSWMIERINYERQRR